MTAPTIAVKRRALSASSILAAVGDELLKIKADDGLTLADMGAILNKSDDQVGKYILGTADMGLVTFARGKERWNGRFTGKLDRLVCETRGDTSCDRTKGSSVLKAALALSVALEDDDEIGAGEVHANRATIEAARDALEGLLAKLTSRNATA